MSPAGRALLCHAGLIRAQHRSHVALAGAGRKLTLCGRYDRCGRCNGGRGSRRARPPVSVPGFTPMASCWRRPPAVRHDVRGPLHARATLGGQVLAALKVDLHAHIMRYLFIFLMFVSAKQYEILQRSLK